MHNSTTESIVHYRPCFTAHQRVSLCCNPKVKVRPLQARFQQYSLWGAFQCSCWLNLAWLHTACDVIALWSGILPIPAFQCIWTCIWDPIYQEACFQQTQQYLWWCVYSWPTTTVVTCKVTGCTDSDCVTWYPGYDSFIRHISAHKGWHGLAAWVHTARKGSN